MPLHLCQPKASIMRLKNTHTSWGSVSQFLHWLTVLLILALAVIGLMMGELPRTPKYFWVYTLHKSLGISVLALMPVRLGWRLWAGAPRPVRGTPIWQHMVASVTHWLLYALLLAVPLSGWLYDSASSLRPFRLFGLFEMPKLSGPNEALGELAHSAHIGLFWVMIALVIGHAGAAFWHHLIQRDKTLSRMLPGKKRSMAIE